jgi:FtsZ-interacting cell division protein ZipA
MKKEVNTKHGNRSLITSVILAMLVFFLCFGLSSCRSRKKTLEKSKIELRKETTLDSSGTSKTKAEIKIQANTVAKQVEKSSQVEYEGAQGDSLTVTEKDDTGKVVKETTYKGKGKLKVIATEKTSDQSSSTSKQENTQAENKGEIKKKTLETKKEAAKALKVESKGISFGFWIWLSLAVIIGIILLYLNHRFKWLERVTTVFNK